MEKFTLDNIMQMDPMHDCIVENILLEEHNLIIKYNNLGNLYGPNGKPIYDYKRLTIKYKNVEDCFASLISNRNKIVYIDIERDFEMLKNLIRDYKITSYKYGFDTQRTITLYFDLTKNKGKFVTLEIYLYSGSIVYEWE